MWLTIVTDSDVATQIAKVQPKKVIRARKSQKGLYTKGQVA